LGILTIRTVTVFGLKPVALVDEDGDDIFFDDPTTSLKQIVAIFPGKSFWISGRWK